MRKVQKKSELQPSISFTTWKAAFVNWITKNQIPTKSFWKCWDFFYFIDGPGFDYWDSRRHQYI